MTQPKVSVIVPIYGVEDYIEKCARSLMEQTLDDIEFVFVNDATKDDSMKVLEKTLTEYPDRISQVKIVEHTENKGLPTARHTGLLASIGEYIIHCDSDDFVDRDMYRLMYEKAIEDHCDIVVVDYYEGEDGKWEHKLGAGSQPIDLIDDFLRRCILSSLCNKLIKREIAIDDSIVFPKFNMAEDMALMGQYALLSQNIGYIDRPLYYYYRHQTSILGDRSSEALLEKQNQFVCNFNIVIDAITRNQKYGKYQDAILHECLYIKNTILPALPFTDSYQIWIKTYKGINPKVLFSKMFTYREKLNFIITYLGLYPLYYKLKQTI